MQNSTGLPSQVTTMLQVLIFDVAVFFGVCLSLLARHIVDVSMLCLVMFSHASSSPQLQPTWAVASGLSGAAEGEIFVLTRTLTFCWSLARLQVMVWLLTVGSVLPGIECFGQATGRCCESL